MNNDQHVVCNPDGTWSVKVDVEGRAQSVHQTQTQAIRKADKNARWQSSTVYIHALNGSVREKHNFTSSINPVVGY